MDVNCLGWRHAVFYTGRNIRCGRIFNRDKEERSLVRMLIIKFLELNSKSQPKAAFELGASMWMRYADGRHSLCVQSQLWALIILANLYDLHATG